MNFSFNDLANAPLVPGAIYRGGTNGGLSDEVLSKLIPNLKNSGGIRHVGKFSNPKLIVLTSTHGHRVWPDRLSVDARHLTYFGDNRSRNRRALETIGNRALVSSFQHSKIDRRQCPPVLYFVSTGRGFDQMLVGLFAMGEPTLQKYEWMSQSIFQQDDYDYENFAFKFSRLHTNEIPRDWIESCTKDGPTLDGAPESWRRWVQDSVYQLADPDFQLASGITSASVAELGSSFVDICDRKFVGDPSMLVWVLSSVIFSPVDFCVTDVNKSNEEGVFLIQVESRGASPVLGTNKRELKVRIKVKNSNLETNREVLLSFDTSESSEIEVTTSSIGIELDRIGVRTGGDMEIFLKQCLV